MTHYNVVIAGTGPAGIAASRAVLTERPDAHVLLVEAGRPCRRRPCTANKGVRGAVAAVACRSSIPPKTGPTIETGWDAT